VRKEFIVGGYQIITIKCPTLE